MTLNISIPSTTEELSPKITVIGVGGAGGNAVNNMIESNLEGVEFLAANTDGQALAASLAPRKIQLGRVHTEGLGAGSKPEVGRLAAEESLEEIMAELADSHMVFITAGMGGGTGTGAAPVIARAAREQGILTVGVVTKPFEFEGTPRMRSATQGIDELQAYVDTLIIIPNQNLFLLANERTTFTDAFAMADNVLHQGVSGVTDLMIKSGMINLDFADIRSVMTEMGKAMMGTGEASGESRATNAAEAAIHNPLLDETTLKGAQALLINVTGGSDMTLFEADEAANHIRKEVDNDAIIIFGAIIDPKMEGVMRVSVVATGMETNSQSARPPMHLQTNDKASASDKTSKVANQPFYAIRRKEGVVEKIIAEPTVTAASKPMGAHVGSATAVESKPMEAAHLKNARLDNGAAEPALMPEISDASAETALRLRAEQSHAQDAATDDESQLTIMDMIDAKDDRPATGRALPAADHSASSLDEDDVPFTLGKTVDIPVDEHIQPKETAGLIKHITRLFSSHQQEEKIVQEPIMSDVKPLNLWNADASMDSKDLINPMLQSDEESADEMISTGIDHRATSQHSSMIDDMADDKAEQANPSLQSAEPELDMKNQPDDFDLEIPAFLRRQAN